MDEVLKILISLNVSAQFSMEYLSCSFLGCSVVGLRTCLFAVVIQPYEAEADNEYVIRGNSVVMKCEIPSFVADFVSVTMWQDSEGNNFYPSNDYGNKLLVSVKCGWISLVPFNLPKFVYIFTQPCNPRRISFYFSTS